MNNIELVIPQLSDKISPDTHSNFNLLYNKILAKEIAVFVGAGMSYQTGIPTWKDLLIRLSENLDGYTIPEGDNEEPEIASLLKEEYEKNDLDFFDAIKNIIIGRDLPFLPSHTALLSEYILFCITTNFDDVFDKSIATMSLNVSPQYYPNFRITKIMQDKLCYLHGNIFHNNNIIFTAENYESAYRENGAIDQFIKPAYKENSLMFLGVSFKDKALESIIRDIDRFEHEMWSISEPHFIFISKYRSKENKDIYKHRKLCDDLNLKPIFYYRTGVAENSHYNLQEILNETFAQLSKLTGVDNVL